MKLPEANQAEDNLGEARAAARRIPEPPLDYTASMGRLLGAGYFWASSTIARAKDGEGDILFLFHLIIENYVLT
jgi:hypothetical protein